MPHPNASVAGGGTTLGVLIVWIAGRFHVSLSAEEGALVAGGIGSLALLVGRDGVSGLWRTIWKGKPQPKA